MGFVTDSNLAKFELVCKAWILMCVQWRPHKNNSQSMEQTTLWNGQLKQSCPRRPSVSDKTVEAVQKIICTAWKPSAQKCSVDLSVLKTIFTMF